ncbi:MAG: hypothetical protein M1454_05900 [Candidatus Thermoplasmatota archaeon]|nr:hypothetical protein [Candidatus Thermoplasmatota archaeon]MCL5731371.1 hypothetical protein [Candidatus Thermoplasmatota archaeon]
MKRFYTLPLSEYSGNRISFKVNIMLDMIQRLDWRLRINVEPNPKLSELSRKFGVRSEVGLILYGEQPETILFFPNNVEKNRELRIFLQEFDAIESSGVWTVRLKNSRDETFIRLIYGLLEIPSVVLSGFSLLEGLYYIDFIFNSVDLPGVSKTLSDNLKNDSSEILIDYLGRSNGVNEMLQIVNSRTPLSLFEIDMTPPAEEMKPEKNPMGDKWFRILKTPFGSINVEGLYFVDSEPVFNGGVVEIIKRSMYRTTTKNSFLRSINDRINKSRVVSVLAFQNFNAGSFKVFFVVPTVFKKRFFNILLDVMEQEKDWSPKISQIANITEASL